VPFEKGRTLGSASMLEPRLPLELRLSFKMSEIMLRDVGF